MKKFAVRLGQFDTVDIFKFVGAGILGFASLALFTDVTDEHAYIQGQNDVIDYMNATQQYDTNSASEIRRRGKVYQAKQFLAENEGK